MLHKMKFPLLGIAGLSIMLSAGCNTQPDHPNQLNTFDGSSYNSLTLAHAALTSLRGEISGVLPQYTSVFNDAAGAYAAAFNAYAAFRTQPQEQAAVTVAVSELTIDIVGLENTFAAGMHANPQTAIQIRRKAAGVRARLGRNLTISDILTELEIAAAIAETVPGAQPYSQIAAIVIEATSQALAAEKATSGQRIDLTRIQPVLPIS